MGRMVVVVCVLGKKKEGGDEMIENEFNLDRHDLNGPACVVCNSLRCGIRWRQLFR